MTREYSPLGEAQWPASLADMKGGFATRLNVYRTMAHNPALLKAWGPLREHIVTKNALGAQFSEVVILRTGHRMDAPYEWAHHVSRGRACGMSDERIASIGGPLEGMAENDAVLARAVDELVLNGRLGQEARLAVAALVGDDGLFDVIATTGFYITLGFIVNSFETPIDEDVAAELAARPLEV